MKKSFVIFLIIFLLTGCATIVNRNLLLNTPEENKCAAYRYYPATQTDFSVIFWGGGYGGGIFGFIFTAIAVGLDIPISLTTDTLALPVDFYMIQKCKNQKDNSTKDNIIKQE
jgi:uncharacterized protein YceK